MSEPFLGEIRLFGFNFAPQGWAPCNGQLLSISQNTALFSLLGTTYGGDGRTTFALPDLRGRVPVHEGQGPGLSNYSIGQQGGTETVTLDPSQLPPHGHTVNASTADPDTEKPRGAFLASGNGYAGAADTQMNLAMIGGGGGAQPHENRQPYLALNFCIALQGIFPSRS